MKIKTTKPVVLLLVLAVTCTGFAADGHWPMWRGDASRTGASSNPLPDKLSLLWHQNMGYPDAAFIHQMRMCADAAYAPVAADGLVFVPSNLLTYRNAATEVFDYQTKTRLNFNSVRAGCTANFLPADGVLNAPSFGHGCVCNYPTFASLAMVNLPEVDTVKPDLIKSRENERSKPVPAGAFETEENPALAGKPMDLSVFDLIDATRKSARGGCIFSTTGDRFGFAIRRAPEALTAGTFTYSFKSISRKGRHKNSFLVFGSSNQPEDLIKIMLYHGGRKRIIISGKHVDEQEVVFELLPNVLTEASVHFDLLAGTVSVKVADASLTTKITDDIPAITHFGYGGSNSDTFLTEIDVTPDR